MADERKYFVICADNCKFESMTKEQILTAIEQAISTGAITDVDTGFVTTVKEQNGGKGVKLWIGTQAEYNDQVASGVDFTNVFCIFTDDTAEEDIYAAIEENAKALENKAAEIAKLQSRTAALENIVFAEHGRDFSIDFETAVDLTKVTKFVGTFHNYETDEDDTVVFEGADISELSDATGDSDVMLQKVGNNDVIYTLWFFPTIRNGVLYWYLHQYADVTKCTKLRYFLR